MNRFSDKIVLVTGGGTGIGFAAASAFAKEGACVIISSRSENGLKAADEIQEKGGRAEFIACDVSSIDSQTDLMQKILSKYGKLDVAVNNAGVEQAPASIEELSLESWEKIVDINTSGVWLGMKVQIPVLKQNSRGGAIVNISSIAAIKALQNISAYAASKAAVNSLTKTAAMECARFNIRVNAICPGPIGTEMMLRFQEQDPLFFKETILDSIPMQRIGKPEEIASAILFAASSDASFMTGQVLVLDGGLSM